MYVVVEVTNTTYYKPGDELSEATVHEINKNPQWKTRTTNFDYLAALGALFGAATQAGVKAAIPGL